MLTMTKAKEEKLKYLQSLKEIKNSSPKLSNDDNSSVEK